MGIDSTTTEIIRPARWDQPFDPEMNDRKVTHILGSERFKTMREDNFLASLPLRELIKNDCRLRHYQPNQLITFSGEYLNSAFVILSGSATMILPPGIDPKHWGRITPPKPTLLGSIYHYIVQSQHSEYRNSQPQGTAQQSRTKPILIDKLFDKIGAANSAYETLKVGDIFGESAVLGRNINQTTVIANESTEVLEIRWQALRDISMREPDFKHYIDTLYRERGLYHHLLSVPLFHNVSAEKIKALAEVALFEVHGAFEWFRDYQKTVKAVEEEKDVNKIIASEPVIAHENDYPDGLLLIRQGFTRISRQINHGHYTIGYGSANGMFGLDELYYAWRNKQPVGLNCSLRSIGYTDIIRIPTAWLETHIFSVLPEQEIAKFLQYGDTINAKQEAQTPKIDRQLTEFFVEKRYINGTQTMVIDLERCTRCDECVKACANSHDGNPRFIRQGPKHNKYMIANACMHCEDPVCMIGCPTGAIHRDLSGVVKINDNTCIGCSTCANSCPYNNIRMVEIRDDKGAFFMDQHQRPIMKATKCDLCVDNYGGPACERACPHDALTRMDLKDLDKLKHWIER